MELLIIIRPFPAQWIAAYLRMAHADEAFARYMHGLQQALHTLQSISHDILYAGHILPANSSANLRTSFFLYVLDLLSIVDLAESTSSRPCNDDSHAGER